MLEKKTFRGKMGKGAHAAGKMRPSVGIFHKHAVPVFKQLHLLPGKRQIFKLQINNRTDL